MSVIKNEGDSESFIGTFVFPAEGQVPKGLIYAGKTEHPVNTASVEEYVDDDDPGFDAYVVNEQSFVASCKELAT